MSGGSDDSAWVKSSVKAATTSSQGADLRLRKLKKGSDRRWADKYERFYKDSKKFNIKLLKGTEPPYKLKVAM